ncbi:MAG: hypothetical protein LBS15_03120 [Endomicrobium sp.]|jgi:16S rRNA processing protein RimM|nr:hypothetical protein [Endomicrobium sp.]
MNDIKRKILDTTNIVGFEVFDQGGARVGLLSGVVSASSNDVWVVKDCDEEILIPALMSVIIEVNVLRRKIFVVLPKKWGCLCEIYDRCS